MDLEKICSIACYLLALVFFVIAICVYWPHFFTMSVCLATGVLVAENESSRTP